jgi:hypothetical protein
MSEPRAHVRRRRTPVAGPGGTQRSAPPRATAGPWGLMAEYATAEALVAAAQAAHDAGYRLAEAYAPYPVEGLAQALGFARSRVPAITFAGGLAGGLGGWFLQWYSAVVDFPVEVGARPLNSWPMFVPVTFEMTILGAALAAFFAVILGNGLPRLAHPVFDAPDFDLAMRNRFFLCLRSDDPAFDAAQADALLAATRPIACTEVQR